MPSHFFRNYLDGLDDVLKTISGIQFSRLTEELKEVFEHRGNIFIFGNGGSGSTASHFASDMNKGVSYGKNPRFKVICLNDNLPTLLAYANDVSYEDVFVEQLKNFLEKGDLVIGLSGSGDSENVLRAIQYAGDCGAKTWGICGFGGGKLREAAAKSLVINSHDMQFVEDAHCIVLHCIMKWFKKGFEQQV